MKTLKISFWLLAFSLMLLASCKKDTQQTVTPAVHSDTGSYTCRITTDKWDIKGVIQVTNFNTLYGSCLLIHGTPLTDSIFVYSLNPDNSFDGLTNVAGIITHGSFVGDSMYINQGIAFPSAGGYNPWCNVSGKKL